MARVTNIGTVNNIERFALDKDDIKYFNIIAANFAREELAYEKKMGNLINHNRFVDGKQNVPEEAIRFGGKIIYEDVHSVREVINFIDKTVKKLTPRITGDLRDSHRWTLNGNAVQGDASAVIVENAQDQLVCFAHIRYAKYQEAGTVKNSAKKMYRLTALRAQRRFGRAFIIKHVMIQDRELKSSSKMINKKSKRGKYKAYSKQYYKERWENSYPGIKIALRGTVGYKEGGAVFTKL